MSADTHMLVNFLATAALIAATAEYAAMIRRRVMRRVLAREHCVLEDLGLQSLVRVLLADPPAIETPARAPAQRAADTRRTLRKGLRSA
jgi:hypothetical protein